MTKACIRKINDRGVIYEALMFCCPGCAERGGDGIHMLPIGGYVGPRPSWDWDGNLGAPTLSPSILTRTTDTVCHSFLRAGVFEFLGDCTHSLAGQSVPMGDLPSWAIKEAQA